MYASRKKLNSGSLPRSLSNTHTTIWVHEQSAIFANHDKLSLRGPAEFQKLKTIAFSYCRGGS
jgi:hypothetical protein